MLQLLFSHLQLICAENVHSTQRIRFNAHVAYNNPLYKSFERYAAANIQPTLNIITEKDAFKAPL